MMGLVSACATSESERELDLGTKSRYKKLESVQEMWKVLQLLLRG